MMETKHQLMWIITALGGVTLVGVFARLRGGLHAENQRVVVVILVLTFVSLIAVTSGSAGETVGVAVAGASLGYLLGLAERLRTVGVTAEELNAALDSLAGRIMQGGEEGPGAPQGVGGQGGEGGAQIQAHHAPEGQQPPPPGKTKTAGPGGGGSAGGK